MPPPAVTPDNTIKMGRMVILDAGSSGTRLYAYDWKEDGSAPKVRLALQGLKAQGAIEKNAHRVAAYLKEIFDPVVPEGGRNEKTKKAVDIAGAFGFATADALKEAKVPVFVLGTAGMRVYDLGHADHMTLHNEISSSIKSLTEYSLSSCEYHTITGTDEAAYGWVAANYLLGAFSAEKQTQIHDMVGYVEMGGQSTQIAFLPFENELTPDKLYDGEITTVTMGGREYDLVLKTWDLGSNQAWREYQSDVAATGTPQATTIPDTDSPRGRKWVFEYAAKPLEPVTTVTLEGTGAFNSQRFHQKVLDVLDRLSEPVPARGTRLLDENLVAALHGRHFVGGANFWYSTRGVFGKNVDDKGTPKTTVFSFEEYAAEVQSTTELSWPYLQFRLRHSDEKIVGNAWFVAEWIKCVLIDGLGFNFAHQPSGQRETDLSFRPFGGIGNTELTWTLGRAVLYANQPADKKNEKLVGKPGLDIIAARHQKKLNDAMITKANRLEEKIWDYITMAASFRSLGVEVRGNAERATRMIDLAEAAATTSFGLRFAAWKGAIARSILELGNGEDAENVEKKKDLSDMLESLNSATMDGSKSERLNRAVDDLITAGAMNLPIHAASGGTTDPRMSAACAALVNVIRDASGSLVISDSYLAEL